MYIILKCREAREATATQKKTHSITHCFMV